MKRIHVGKTHNLTGCLPGFAVGIIKLVKPRPTQFISILVLRSGLRQGLIMRNVVGQNPDMILFASRALSLRSLREPVSG